MRRISDARLDGDHDPVSGRARTASIPAEDGEGYPATFPRPRGGRARRAGRSPTGYAFDSSEAGLPDDGVSSPFFPSVGRSVRSRASTIFASGWAPRGRESAHEAGRSRVEREVNEEGVRMWYSCVTPLAVDCQESLKVVDG